MTPIIMRIFAHNVVSFSRLRKIVKLSKVVAANFTTCSQIEFCDQYRQTIFCRKYSNKTENTERKEYFGGVPDIDSGNMAAANCLEIGGFSVYPWAISGLESCIVVEREDYGKESMAFDIGYATRNSMKCRHVFISHGHIDHISGIMSHVGKRRLFAGYTDHGTTYYIPSLLKEPLIQVSKAFAAMGEENELANTNFEPVEPGQDIYLAKGLRVQAFPTVHRVKSQGYIVYKKRKVLKEEFKDITGPEKGRLVASGTEIYDIVETPDLAYTGDTTFDLFLNPPTPDLLKVKLLITECTYIDDHIGKDGKDGVQRAKQWGHTHLQEFVDNKQLFDNVENMLFVHFSDKYSVPYINRKMDELVPEDFRSKIHISTYLKEMDRVR